MSMKPLASPSRFLASLFAAFLCCTLFPAFPFGAAAAGGQDLDARTSKEPDDQERIEWRKKVDRQAARYEFFLWKDGPQALSAPKAILRWANPTRITHSESGTYLWTFQGRPVVLGAMYTTNEPGTPVRFAQHFQTLWPTPIEAECEGRRVWYPPGPGCEYHPIPDAPSPRSSAPARLLQMRSLSRQFSATLVRWRDDGSDREELRLFPTPLYRYEIEEEADSEVIDGGLFAFVQGTDPEVALVIEAVREPEGLQWRYALLRRSCGALEARHRGKLVWKVPYDDNATDRKWNHINFHDNPEPQ